MPQQLGEVIRKYRKQNGYTMTQLADKLRISIGLLSNIETGKTDSFQLNLLKKVVKELNIPISELGLFSEPYPIEALNINLTKDFNKIRPSIEKLINAFITTSTQLSFDEIKIASITDMLVKELQTINQLTMSSESK